MGKRFIVNGMTVDELLAFHREHFGDTRMEAGEGEGGAGEGDQGGEDGFKPITTQDELNRIIGDRVKRAKPADYDDLKAKAAKFDQLEQANKSEIDKANERAEAAEKAANEAKVQILRQGVALEHKLSTDDAKLLDSITDETAMRALAGRLAQADSDRKKNGNHASKEGATHKPAKSDDLTEFARHVFGRSD